MKTKLNFNSKFIATMLFTMAMLWLPQICSRVMAQEAYAVFDATTGTLTFKYDNNKPAGAYEMNKGEKNLVGLPTKKKLRALCLSHRLHKHALHHAMHGFQLFIF